MNTKTNTSTLALFSLLVALSTQSYATGGAVKTAIKSLDNAAASRAAIEANKRTAQQHIKNLNKPKNISTSLPKGSGSLGATVKPTSHAGGSITTRSATSNINGPSKKFIAAKKSYQSNTTLNHRGPSLHKTTLSVPTSKINQQLSKNSGSIKTQAPAAAPPTSVTHRGHKLLHNRAHEGPYGHLKDSSKVGKGKDYTQTSKQKIYAENRNRNGGVLRDDNTGEFLVPGKQHTRGVKPPKNEAQIDHTTPKSRGGSNSFSNAQVLSRQNNIQKSNK